MAKTPGGRGNHLQWWEAPRGEAGAILASAVEALSLHPEQLAREDRYLDYARLYGNQELRALRFFTDTDWEASGDTITPTKFGYNVCKAVPDTVASKLAESPARVSISTNGGNRRERKRAELATRFVDGLFWVSGFTEERMMAQLDALVFDFGAIEWSVQGARIKATRVFPWEVLWDPADGRTGDPFCLYRPQRLHWTQVCAEYKVTPEQRETIKAQSSRGYVWLDKGWCKPYDLPSKEEREAVLAQFPNRPEQHGRHVVQCCGITLRDVPWCRDKHPIQIYRWDRRPTGAAGMGLVEQVLPYYSEIVRLMGSWRTINKLGATLKVATQMGTQVQGMSNEQGERYNFKTVAPQFFVPNVSSGNHLNDADTFFRKALEVSGLSMMDVAGRKEPGIDSGKAIREFRAITTQRFALQVKSCDMWAVSNAEVGLAMARELFEKNQSMQVRSPGTRLIEQIDWKDIDLEEDGYILQPEPTGIIPRTIAGKKQTADEWLARGTINRLQYLEMVQTADELATITLELAPKRRIERMIDAILDDGKYETPDEFVAFDLALRMGVQALSEAEKEKVPERRIRLLRQWIDEVARVQKTVAGASQAASQLAAQDQAAAAATQAAQGNPLANPAGAPMAPTAPMPVVAPPVA